MDKPTELKPAELKVESKLDQDQDQLLEQYIESLSSKEKQSYLIAKEHLGMSFQLEKSVGFLKWLKK